MNNAPNKSHRALPGFSNQSTTWSLTVKIGQHLGVHFPAHVVSVPAS